jgi:CspA family cold shock protein
MNQGKVKFFNESKGYGFFIDNEPGKEYFLHISGLVDQVKKEDGVIFELAEEKKGLNAVDVRLA